MDCVNCGKRIARRADARLQAGLGLRHVGCEEVEVERVTDCIRCDLRAQMLNLVAEQNRVRMAGISKILGVIDRWFLRWFWLRADIGVPNRPGQKVLILGFGASPSRRFKLYARWVVTIRVEW